MGFAPLNSDAEDGSGLTQNQVGRRPDGKVQFEGKCSPPVAVAAVASVVAILALILACAALSKASESPPHDDDFDDSTYFASYCEYEGTQLYGLPLEPGPDGNHYQVIGGSNVAQTWHDVRGGCRRPARARARAHVEPTPVDATSAGTLDSRGAATRANRAISRTSTARKRMTSSKIWSSPKPRPPLKCGLVGAMRTRKARHRVARARVRAPRARDVRDRRAGGGA